MKKKRKDVKPKKKHTFIKIFSKTVLGVGAVTTLAVGAYTYKTINQTPSITEQQLKSDSSSNMYASDGTLLWSSAQYKRNYVKAEDIPVAYKNFLLSTEDAEYYKNKGFSPKGFAAAVLSYVKEKLGRGEARGGSGIEQQLIKLTAFSTQAKDRTIDRKIKELFLALQMDSNFSKEKILEFYVNKIYVGENAYGANTIAHVYFGKELKDLSLSQQAIIAGLGQSPSAYNLYNDPDLVKLRRDIVAKRAKITGKITKAQYKEIIKTPVTWGLLPRGESDAKVVEQSNIHNAFITSALGQIADLGYDMTATPLQIKTTLNMDIENKAKSIMDTRQDLFQSPNLQAATTIIDPQTGNVLSEIGGRNSSKIGNLNRATSTMRSSGSSIKPILDYGPALEYFNWATNKTMDGSAYRYKGTNLYAYDYGKTTHANPTIQESLRQSYNIPALRTLDEVGDSRARAFIGKLGIKTKQVLEGSPAIGLDASTTQMASAMGAFGQDGLYHRARYIESIVFSDDSEKKIEFKPVQAMRKSTAYIITSMLKGVPSAKGTMPNGAINGVNYAAKTGTVAYPDGTYNANMGMASDVWTVGYTKSLSIAVWQGFDNPMEPGNGITDYWSHEQAYKVFKELMSQLSQGRDNSDWEKPETVNLLSGAGLDAQYVATDSPSALDSKTITRPQLNGNQEYGAYTTRFKANDLVPKKPATPKAPKGYVMGSWRKELELEKKRFNEAHKHDEENARRAGDN